MTSCSVWKVTLPASVSGLPPDGRKSKPPNLRPCVPRIYPTCCSSMYVGVLLLTWLSPRTLVSGDCVNEIYLILRMPWMSSGLLGSFSFHHCWTRQRRARLYPARVENVQGPRPST